MKKLTKAQKEILLTLENGDEAMVMLAPYGVERITMIPSIHPDGTPTWRITQNGEDHIYCADLGTVVWALEVANDRGSCLLIRSPDKLA